MNTIQIRGQIRAQIRRMNGRVWIPILAIIFTLGASGLRAQQKAAVIRIGYFANITHAQALVGRANGQFEKDLGPGVRIEWKAFNAGPSAIEALFAGAIDMTYVGPNPAVTGYVRSQGQAVRLIAGAASGGASLVVREGSGIKTASDFHGRKVATPQQGNTQDVALRAWLRANGMKPREKGGDVQVLPISNADQLTLFLKGQLDLWPNHQFAITGLVVQPKFLKEHPDIVKNFLRAHVELTDWISKNPDQAKQIMNQQLQKETGKSLSAEVMNDAFSRLQVTYDPIRASILKSTQQAFDEGFLGRTQPNLSGFYDLTLLNEVLREKKASPVQ